MEGTSAATIINAAFSGFGDLITGAAPGLLTIGVLAFGIGYLWRFGKRLVS